MKNGKKILILAVALSVLCALMCVNAFAAEEPTISTITKKVNNVEFEYGENAVNFGMTYSGDRDGMFLVLVLGDGTPTDNDGNFAPKAEHILYVNQTTSSGGEVSFAGDNVIYPSGIEDKSMVCLAGAGLDKITLLGVITANQVEPDYMLGDVTGDDRVNARDVTALRKYLISQTLYPLNVIEAADVTGDTRINARDVTSLRKYLISSTLYPFPATEK